MLGRKGKRLTTLLSSSSSKRLYSSPTGRRNAPATAASRVEPSSDFPAYLTPGTQQYQPAISQDMENFLRRGAQRTLLPHLIPVESPISKARPWFMDTATQDQLAMMDVCLHGMYDVRRARHIFEILRKSDSGAVLETRMYNSLLEAYLNMGLEHELERDLWVESAWELYDDLEGESERCMPTSGTYAIMILVTHRFRLGGEKHVFIGNTHSYARLLTCIKKRGINIQEVIGDRVFTDQDEAAEIIKNLSKAAIEIGLTDIVKALGQAETMATHGPDALDGIAEVKPVMRPKKADGTEAAGEDSEPVLEVPFNLDNLRRHLAQIIYTRRVIPEDITSRQKLLEDSVYETASERLKHEADILSGLGLNNPIRQVDLRQWMWEWHTKLKDRLADEIKALSLIEAKNASRSRVDRYVLLSPYLSLVNPERLSLLTIFEIMRLPGSGGIPAGMKTTRALIQVGKAVELEYKAQMCKKNHIYIPLAARAGAENFFSNLGYQSLQERRLVAARHVEDGEAWTANWSQVIRAKIGGMLVECLMDVAEVTRRKTNEMGIELTEVQPAFFHSYEHFRGTKLGVIRLNAAVAERLATDASTTTLHPRHLPMLVKPKPWIKYDDGGYLYSKTNVMRFKDSVEQQSYLKRASDLGNVELVYAGLDVLGSTPWKINEKIFHVVLEVWNSGERLGKLPPASYDRPAPIQPEQFKDMREKQMFNQSLKLWKEAKANNHSDRCNVNYKIEIARAFLGDTFYQPHNLDFRGRAYPIPPHLNHIGDDLSRGLLRFAESKPLGERGLRWLKIQLAGLYGYDKASFDDRVKWVGDHLDDIYDSALHPLEGRGFWKQADDPWQCLACCMELHAALTSPDPLKFESTCPVHQDGTCNGLQHYAALGGDATGAAQVNLQAGDKPSDVYTYVGNMAEEIIALDAAKGIVEAQTLQGKIFRKLVKQTVMTTVYGVTFIGARDQIEKQLKHLPSMVGRDTWVLAAYLAKVVLHCIGDLFSGAKSIQNWLSLSASLIAKSIPAERFQEAIAEQAQTVMKRSKKTKGKPYVPAGLNPSKIRQEQLTAVIWTTPLGLPIVQPYRKTKRKQIITNVQTVFIEDPNSPSAVNSQKQASAFPPNFVHSLDATHMMLTALECRTQDITYAAVHDSYWTHASSIDKMSAIIRDTFIALHSSGVLEKLREEFIERYSGFQIPLSNVLVPGMMRKMIASGSTIKVTKEDAKMFAGYTKIVKLVDDPAESSLSSFSVDLSADEERDIDEDEQELLDEMTEDERTKYLVSVKKTNEVLNARKADIASRLVKLSDLIPPLPEKGSFNVEKIKESAYFFS